MSNLLLRRCLEKVDRVSVSNGAMTFLDALLDDILLVLEAKPPPPPWTPEQERILKAMIEFVPPEKRA